MARSSSLARIGAIGAFLLLAVPALAQQGLHTPAPGSSERKAIMDAMRAIGDLPDRVFVVKVLRVANGWAWLSVNPQSPDGKQRYEPESALLHNGDYGWTVVDQPCAEEACDAKAELARIRAAYPAAPAAIFGR
jgi:hypothetical protein